MPFKTLATVMKSGGVFLSALTFGILEIHYLPAPGKIALLVIVMLVDLCTGLIRSWKRGHVTTSHGLKQTAIKVGTYAAIIVAVAAMANVLADITPSVEEYYVYFVTGMVGFLTFVEIYSIFENIYESDPDSCLSVYVCGPALKWMRGYLKKNHPISRKTEGPK